MRLPSPEDHAWYHVLLAMLVVSMTMGPVVDVLGRGDLLLASVRLVVLLACVMAMGQSRASRLVAWAALVPAVVLLLFFPASDTGLRLVGEALGALIMLLVCYRILQRIFAAPRVTWAMISGAIAVFLLLSTVWTMLYTVAAWEVGLEPAFNGVPPASELLRSPDLEVARAEVQGLLSYFSIVTLTTLGYGDLSPAHPITRSLATAEAVVGQLYLVVLVARLVSMHAASTRNGDA
jgi:hypothetical protein